jgi:hypothetical protein
MLRLNVGAGGNLEPISKMSLGPKSLLVTRFPALLDSPSDLILSVGHKPEVRRACPGEAFRRRRNLEPKSYF